MRDRLRALGILFVLLLAGAFLGSAWVQYAERSAPPVGGARIPGVPGATGVPGLRPAAPSERIRVEVLNAAGRQGLARDVTTQLRDLGFDVVSVGNAPTFDREASVVTDRVGRIDLARAVADALGIRTVLSEPDSNLYLDVSVYLGQDWMPPGPGVDQPVQAADSTRWWDLRRFFR